jgi:hypothetical protein
MIFLAREARYTLMAVAVRIRIGGHRSSLPPILRDLVPILLKSLRSDNNHL